MYKISANFVLILSLLAIPIIGYSNLIKGIVYDEDLEPLFNVTISSNDGSHFHTNVLGKFTIESNLGDTLVFSYLGYENHTLIVNEEAFDKNQKIEMKVSNIIISQVSVTNSIKEVSNVSKIDLAINPVKSSQEVLNQVPGLFIAQHAGGGKAEQIFLRGFDIDHGTDIGITVDGLPVNMVSHAHGQGYADLHFLIPETIENIDFGKGPYYSESGNFTTAGYVNFQTKDKLEKSIIGVRAGQFNSTRVVGLFNIAENTARQNGYVGGEFLQSDGPFDASQNFKRVNLIGKYKATLNEVDKIEVLASYFTSSWDASGQIPQRAIDNGSIGRFGAIDSTEGGQTSRMNLSIEHFKVIDMNTFIKSRIYHVRYGFELFSNFTFFLNNPIDGDQIRQYEERGIYGVSSTFNKSFLLDDSDLDFQLGIGLRYDDVNDNELSNTKNRTETLGFSALGNIDETNFELFSDVKWSISDWTINLGSRLDIFRFQYNDLLTPLYDPQSVSKMIISPKFNVVYNPNNKIQYYFKSGKSFHSNDSRLAARNPNENILPSAYGADLGIIWKPIPDLWINTAAWYLFLEQEFVYVGDEAVVEPSGRTARRGIDLTLRYNILESLYLNTDFNYTIARSIDELEGQNFIPLAPEMTSVGGLSYMPNANINASIRYRYIRDRAANEDNSIIAQGYGIFDVSGSYKFKNVSFILSVENLLDTNWNEAQFATESRLFSEPNSIEEIHFTPGNPRNVSVELQYQF